MSDMKHVRIPEDLAIEQAWDQVMATDPSRRRRATDEGEPRLSPGSEDAAAGLVREYTELLGLLPYELPAETPPARVKQAIMAQIGASGIDTSGTVAASPVVPFERPAPRRETPAPRPIWRFAQAAVLAAALLGLGFLSATVRQQDRQIARLSERAGASALDRSKALEARQEIQTLRSRIDMITTVARQAYPLRTVSQVDSMKKPEGIVYVCGLHQQWYLNLRGLEPPADGGEYHLWFMTENGKVDGGVLEVRDDTSSEMEAQTMPPGTHGFLVTLEKRNEPESLTILLGESAINL